MIKGLAPQSPLLFPASTLLRLRAGDSLSEDRLRSLVRDIFPGTRAYFLSSGRACLYALLKALVADSGKDRDRVVIPAYTCPSVPFTVKRAGLQVLLCDFEPFSFTLSVTHLDRLLDDRVLAVLPTHLFGFPSDLAAVRRLSAPRGVTVVEDFAHAVGTAYRGQPAGTLADFAFTSLGRGKMLTTDEGGILLAKETRDTHKLETQIAELETEKRSRWSLALRLGLVHFLIAGSRWGLISGSPLDPEKAEKSYRFDPKRLSALQLELLRSSLLGLAGFSALRQQRAAELAEGLQNAQGLILPREPEGSETVPMMFPVFFEDRERLERAYADLRRKRLGPSRMYRHSLNIQLGRGYVNRDEDFPEAEFLAEHLLTLPCHPYISRADVARVVDAVKTG